MPQHSKNIAKDVWRLILPMLQPQELLIAHRLNKHLFDWTINVAHLYKLIKLYEKSGFSATTPLAPMLEDIIDEDAPLETQVKILNWIKRTYLQHLPIHETQDMVPFTNIAALINKQLQLMLSMSIKSVTKTELKPEALDLSKIYGHALSLHVPAMRSKYAMDHSYAHGVAPSLLLLISLLDYTLSLNQEEFSQNDLFFYNIVGFAFKYICYADIKKTIFDYQNNKIFSTTIQRFVAANNQGLLAERDINLILSTLSNLNNRCDYFHKIEIIGLFLLSLEFLALSMDSLPLVSAENYFSAQLPYLVFNTLVAILLLNSPNLAIALSDFLSAQYEKIISPAAVHDKSLVELTEVVVVTEEKTNASSSLSHRHGFFTSSSAKTTSSVSDNHLKLI